MADFVDLEVQFGVGDYHLNRYRVVFNGPPNMTSQQLAGDFITNFKNYFNSAYATVEPQTRTFEGAPTLMFHGFMYLLKVDVGHVHHDWVVQKWIDPNLGFTAQTLQRLFVDIDDFEAAPAILGGPAGVDLAEANKKHFLAGRRSWVLTTGKCFGIPDNLMVLETAAVERFSCRTYQMTNVRNHTEKMIPPIWISNVSSFVDRPGFSVPEQGVPPGFWRLGRNLHGIPVSYLVMNFPSLKSLTESTEFHDVYRIHNKVIDLQAKPPSLFGKLERANAF